MQKAWRNPNFNRVQFEAVRSEAGLSRFVMTPTKWIEQTNAIGIVSKAGRYSGGIYAHTLSLDKGTHIETVCL